MSEMEIISDVESKITNSHQHSLSSVIRKLRLFPFLSFSSASKSYVQFLKFSTSVDKLLKISLKIQFVTCLLIRFTIYSIEKKILVLRVSLSASVI